MPDDLKEEKKTDQGERKRMVVEELGEDKENLESPVEEIKEKVEELQDITEHIGEDVKDSVKVQEEIRDVVDNQKEFIAPKQAPNFNPLIIIIPGVLLLGAFLGGIVFYQKTMKNEDTEVVLTPAPINQNNASSPTPTSVSGTSLTKYSIVIQNGSGIPGEAGKAQSLLELAGFKVSSTGNADSYNYTKTQIRVKSTVEKDYVEALVKALEKNYSVDKNQTLSASSKDDVQVIVGSVKSSK